MDRTGLSRYQSERLREHLDACAFCQEQLAAEIEIRPAMKAAGRKLGWPKFGRVAFLGLAGSAAHPVARMISGGSALIRLQNSWNEVLLYCDETDSR